MLLSGLTQPLLLWLGLASVTVTVLIANRMDLIDHEGHPIHLSLKGFAYWPWLIWEIAKTNVDVARVILRRDMPIEPTVLDIEGSQKSELGFVIYGNSITLTPGTVTVVLEGEKLQVHALTRSAADDLLSGEMDRRVALLEGLGGGEET
jgi:multicomponent Na+:H+ antiporter subunit E